MYVALFPGLLHFRSSVCIQYNMRMRKNTEKCGRPGNTYYVNDIRWMRGGHRWGLHSNNVLDFHHRALHRFARPQMFTRSQALCWTGNKLIYCTCACSWVPTPPSPTSTLHPPNAIHMHPCIVLNTNQRTKIGGGLGTRLVCTCMWILMFVLMGLQLKYLYCLVKECPWAEYLTNLPKLGVGTLSSVATTSNYMYMKERPCVFTQIS